MTVLKNLAKMAAIALTVWMDMFAVVIQATLVVTALLELILHSCLKVDDKFVSTLRLQEKFRLGRKPAVPTNPNRLDVTTSWFPLPFAIKRRFRRKFCPWWNYGNDVVHRKTVKGLNPGVISKVGWVWSSGWTWSWIGLLLVTVTDVSTTCAVVTFRVKVSCITSVDGIVLWLLIWLVNYVAMLWVVCQLSRAVIGYEDS